MPDYVMSTASSSKKQRVEVQVGNEGWPAAMGPGLLTAINHVYADEEEDAEMLPFATVAREQAGQLEFQDKLDETMRQFWTNEVDITMVRTKWPQILFCAQPKPFACGAACRAGHRLHAIRPSNRPNQAHHAARRGRLAGQPTFLRTYLSCGRWTAVAATSRY